MLYGLKKNVYVRHYEKISLITCPMLQKEEVVDDFGGVFLSQLSYENKPINLIVKNLESIFNVDEKILKTDAIQFYDRLVDDGYLNKIDNGSVSTSALNSSFAITDINPKHNLIENSIKYLNRYFLDNPHLLNFQIELTDKCNERCIHCYIPHPYKTHTLDENFVLDILSQCKDMGVLTVSFSGGEPMLHPSFSEFLKVAKEYDMNVAVFSNLTLLTDEIIYSLKYKHPSTVRVSLYSMNSNIHDRITCFPGSFKKTTENIIKLVENGIDVVINCPIMQPNKNDFEKVIRWGNELGCRVVNDYMIIAKSDGCTENLKYRLTNDDLPSVIRKILYINSLLDPSMLQYEETIKNHSEERICGVGVSTLSLSSTGKVFPCAGWNNCECGDLKKEKLKDIWETSDMINYLRNLRVKDFKKCNDCEHYDFCSMCIARNSNEDSNGDIFNIAPITCEAAAIHHSVLNKLKLNN